MAAAPFILSVNGVASAVERDERSMLLTVLRHDLDLKGSRFGCGQERCGACMVLVDGAPTPSCTLPLWAVLGKQVVTIEGLSAPGAPGRVQQAFLDEQAAQCGYCTDGIMVSIAGLLARFPRPSRAAILDFLDERHLCRCGAHPRILRALDRLLADAAA